MGIVTPSWYAAPWASAQALALLSPARMAAGFPSGLAQRPTRQDLNRALEFASNGVLYFMSHGVPEWLAEAQYPTGSVVAHAGRYWRANALLQGVEPGSGAWEALPWRRSELDALYLARDAGDALFLNAATADARFYPRAEMTSAFITPALMAASFAPVASLTPLLTRLMANAQFVTQAQGDARWASLADAVPGLQVYLRMNSAGPAVGNFVAGDDGVLYDENRYLRNWGNPRTTSGEPDLSGLTNPAPVDVYRTFTYQNNSWQPNVGIRLQPNTTYRVRWHLWAYNNWPQTLTQDSATGLVLATFSSQPPQIADFEVTTGSDGMLKVVAQSSLNIPAISGVEILQAQFDWTLPLLSRTNASANFISTLEPQRWLNGQTAPSIFVTNTQAAETMQDKETAAMSVYSPTRTYRAGVLVFNPQSMQKPMAPIQISCGDDYDRPPFVSDRNFDGGAPYGQGTPVDLSQAVDPAPAGAYWFFRYSNASFSYTFTDLTPHTLYRVRLHFRTYSDSPFYRFDVLLNDELLLADWSIYAAAGLNTAYIYEVERAPNVDGQLIVTCRATANEAWLFALEVLPIPATGTFFRSQADGNVGNALSNTAWWRPWSLPTAPSRESTGRFLEGRIYQTPGTYTLGVEDVPALAQYPEGVYMKFRMNSGGGGNWGAFMHGGGEGVTMEAITRLQLSDFPLTLTVLPVGSHNVKVSGANNEVFFESDAGAAGTPPILTAPGNGASVFNVNPRLPMLSQRIIRGANGRWGFPLRGGDGGGVHGASGLILGAVPQAALYGGGGAGFASPRLFAINAGGGAVGTWQGDGYFSASVVDGPHYQQISLQRVTNPAPELIYQTCRRAEINAGAPFTATLPVVAMQMYRVRLHFCDGWNSVAGMRLANISINGRRFLTNFDTALFYGGFFYAMTRELFIVPTTNQLAILFETVGNLLAPALVNGIEVHAPTRFALNVGGSGVYDWMDDQAGTISASIVIHEWMPSVDLTQTANPAPVEIYQNCRYNEAPWSIQFYGLPNERYRVRLHTVNDITDRIYHVYINGIRVASDVRPLAMVGQNTALAMDFETQADGSGNIVIVFETVVANSVICGVEIELLRTSDGGDGFVEVYWPPS